MNFAHRLLFMCLKKVTSTAALPTLLCSSLEECCCFPQEPMLNHAGLQKNTVQSFPPHP